MNRALAAIVLGCTLASAHVARADDASLSTDAIDKVIRARAGLFRACYERELQRTPALGETKVAVSFDIVTTGLVENAAVTTSSKNDALDGCVIRAVKTLKFPTGTTTKVKYPFKFAPG